MNIPVDFLLRSHYTAKVHPYIGKNIIKVFTGQRRVGKSYLLYQIMFLLKNEDPEASILYINKEDIEFSFIKNAEALNSYVLTNKSNSGKTYVFIDEIQDIEQFDLALRSLLLHQDLDLYCTGSNANLLSSDIAGNLSGRYVEIVVHSLSYNEFVQFHNLEEDDDAVEKYLKFGGLPYLKHLPLESNIIFEYLKNIYSTIVYRDIINRYAVRNTLFLEQLVQFLASNTGSLFSAKKISDFLKSQGVKIAPNQVQLYVQYLVNAFLIHKVPRYDIVGKRIFEIGEKYYFENLGVRHGIWGYRIEDRGKVLENVVYNHLIFKGYKVTVGTIDQLEIDFIAEKEGERNYYQVALSINDPKTLSREFGNLKRITDNYPKMVITYDRFKGNSFDGIQTKSLREFLTS